jgi:cystathionine beta-lyase/cystathionine gamma-synthase
MARRIDDVCPRPEAPLDTVTRPLAAPIYPSTVYQCESTEQAFGLLAGTVDGFVYSRDGHPNANLLADRCAELHGTDRALVTGSGMSALALALVALLKQGDHVVVSNQLYGKSLALWTGEAPRLGIDTTAVEICDLASVEAALQPNTKLVLAETIANPMLRVPDIEALAKLAHSHSARLLIDNTFASPAVCQPAQLGADLVMESVTKIMNGHSDVMLGLLCFTDNDDERLKAAHSVWGLFPSPIDCWLAARGISTLALRAQRASANARDVASTLASRQDIEAVYYPGLSNHIDHAIAARQFGNVFGNIVTFTLPGGTTAADRFIQAAADSIPFCPSLGELSTTQTHPASTSHRLMTEAEREAIEIRGGTIRLSVGIESSEHIISALGDALSAIN